MSRSKVRTINGKQDLALVDYLKDNSHEGVIELRLGDLVKAASIHVGVDIAPSSVTRRCEDLDIKYHAQISKGRNGANEPALANRVAVLEQKVEYLMNEWKGAGCGGES
jgi:hypothetical protein